MLINHGKESTFSRLYAIFVNDRLQFKSVFRTSKFDVFLTIFGRNNLGGYKKSARVVTLPRNESKVHSP